MNGLLKTFEPATVALNAIGALEESFTNDFVRSHLVGADERINMQTLNTTKVKLRFSGLCNRSTCDNRHSQKSTYV